MQKENEKIHAHLKRHYFRAVGLNYVLSVCSKDFEAGSRFSLIDQSTKVSKSITHITCCAKITGTP